MNIEVLLGRSEIYDILTHLTFLFIEADKIVIWLSFRMKTGNRHVPSKLLKK
jgi:hypothetical protein